MKRKRLSYFALIVLVLSIGAHASENRRDSSRALTSKCKLRCRLTSKHRHSAPNAVPSG